LRRLSEISDSRVPLGTLKRVISAGAPARADVLAKLSANLPAETQIFTPYGATESLPVANIGSQEILGETKAKTDAGAGVCIGRPVAGVQVHVIPISEEVISEWYPGLELPVGEIGEFVVRSAVTTREYFRRPDATALAKIRDGDVILHRMGDVGYRDEAGRLWFCGRKSHRVVTQEQTYFTDQVEPIFNTLLGIFRSALVGVKVRGETVPVICFERENVRYRLPDGWDFEAEFRKLAQPLGISRYLFHPGFPVDVRHNSKIFREKLAVWAQKKIDKLA
jgi:olefin beta-lactone synthetase